jgi:phosphoglycerate dehydrogenase-like enzyme
MTSRPRAGVFSRRSRFFDAFTDEHLAGLAEYVDLDADSVPQRLDETAVRRAIRDARVLIGAWGAARLTGALLDACPELELIVYAGGSIKPFYTDEIPRRDITVCSAVEENARPVAEFVLGLILTSLKNVFAYHTRFLAAGGSAWHRDPGSFEGGYYGSRVGILGYGRISRRLIGLLRPFDVEVWLEDPFVSREEAAELGVRLASREELMARCDVVTLHHANTPQNRNLIDARAIDLLKPGARFINTARGGLVDEAALAARLTRGDISAFVDVTEEEPPPVDHPFFELSNCVLTPHIAGSMGPEIHRLGAYCVREIRNWATGAPLENPVDLSSIDHIA